MTLQSNSERPTRTAVRLWQMLGLSSAAYLLLGLAARQASGAHGVSRFVAAGVAIIAGIAFVGISIAIVALIVRLPLGWRCQLAAATGMGAACAAARAGLHILPPGGGQDALRLVGDLLLFAGATFFGASISGVIREPNLLVPVAVVAGAVDTWGVYWGFVAEVAKKAPGIVQHLSAAVPAAARAPIPLLSAIGIGDFLFMGLFVSAVYRLGMDWRRTLWALFAAFLLVPAVFALAEVAALPGLPFLGLAVLVANWRRFRFSRAEKYALLYAAFLVAAVILAALGLRQALRTGE